MKKIAMFKYDEQKINKLEKEIEKKINTYVYLKKLLEMYMDKINKLNNELSLTKTNEELRNLGYIYVKNGAYFIHRSFFSSLFKKLEEEKKRITRVNEYKEELLKKGY
ncbi:MAG TPA: hypothetical protein VGB37_06395 [Candidatus Lokiarchaeia archaeon]